jgi:hypothetical protein
MPQRPPQLPAATASAGPEPAATASALSRIPSAARRAELGRYFGPDAERAAAALEMIAGRVPQLDTGTDRV